MQIRSLTNITSFHILENIRKRRKTLNLKMAINGFFSQHYNKQRKTQIISMKIRNEKGLPDYPLSHSIKFLNFQLTIRHKTQKGIKTRNQEVVLFLSIDDGVIYVRDVNGSTIKSLEPKNSFSKVSGNKSYIQKSELVAFIYTNDGHTKKEIRKNSLMHNNL